MSFPNQDTNNLNFFGGPGNTDGIGDNSPAVKISTEVMVAAVIFLFMLVVFFFVFYLYARRFLSPSSSLSRWNSRRRFVFSADVAAGARRRGLDAAVLNSIPVTVYRSSESKEMEALECAVCLSEVVDGEKFRRLPKCKHEFHVECIDMWFHSHATCPLCRSSVDGEQSSGVELVEVSEAETENPTTVFPTNVLFWGTQDSVNSRDVPAPAMVAGVGVQEGASSSTRVNGGLVINIPSRRVVDGFLSPVSELPSSRMPAEEMKSPVSARFRSLRKLWSRGKTTAGPSCTCSPRDGDVEQGFGGFSGAAAGESSSRTPKTPKTVVNS